MKTWMWVAAAIGGVLLLARKASASEFSTTSLLESDTVASFYGPTGNPTANGEFYDGSGLTAAHRTLPFGTIVRVTDLDSGASVDVRVNDRGPFAKDRSGAFSRSIDLSVEAARAIGLDIQKGLARVRLDKVV